MSVFALEKREEERTGVRSVSSGNRWNWENTTDGRDQETQKERKKEMKENKRGKRERERRVGSRVSKVVKDNTLLGCL